VARYFLELAYNGTDFHGWQMQDNAPSIQQLITEKLSTILQTETSIMGCGRTDAGVHASQFFAHFDAQELPIEIDLIVHKLNTMLPASIAIYGLQQVKDDAHTRFHATKRSYQYCISTRKNPFYSDSSYKFNTPLDLHAMNKACELLLRVQDFGCFCKANADNHTDICTVFNASWEQSEYMITFNITANRFLRNMVRAIVGTLLDVGQGKTSLEEFKLILASKNRSEAGRSVPAHGLFLSHVEYPNNIFLKNE
jgi:tRNA pseudouridine38-40 synthase